MKKRLCLLLALLLLAALTPAYAAQGTGLPVGTEESPAEETPAAAVPEAAVTEEDPLSREALQKLSVEELLSLQTLVNELLVEKGHELFVEIVHGDMGEHVTRLQTQLKALGYFTGQISGKYDNLTEKAVKAFQKANDLPSTRVATQEMQALLYSAKAIAAAVKPKATPTPVPAGGLDYAAYGEMNYRDVARNPEKHLGEKVVLRGTVVQVVGTKEATMILRLMLASGDVVWINVKRGTVDFNVLEDDRLTVYATLRELKTYTSTQNQSITIPQADADAIVLR